MKDIQGVNREFYRVLVADDYAMTRALVSSILKEMGFKYIAQADSGFVALRKLEQEDFDLVICDWNMPAPTGVEVLKKTREDERNKDVIFIMLTAEAYRHNLEEAMAAGVSSYIVKPFTAEVLITKVSSFIDKVEPRHKTRKVTEDPADF